MQWAGSHSGTRQYGPLYVQHAVIRYTVLIYIYFDNYKRQKPFCKCPRLNNNINALIRKTAKLQRSSLRRRRRQKYFAQAKQ